MLYPEIAKRICEMVQIDQQYRRRFLENRKLGKEIEMWDKSIDEYHTAQMRMIVE